MNTTVKGCGCALAIVSALALASPSFAAPVLSSTAGVKSAVADPVTDVRWRRGGVGPGIAAGVIAGAVIGAATAPGYYAYGPAYGSYPAYGYPAYGYGAYAYGAPVYGAPVVGSAYYNGSYAYPYQTCGVDAGYGRWDYSQC